MRKAASWPVFLVILALWQAASAARLLPPYMLPGPFEVGLAMLNDMPLLARHTGRTLFEALAGLALGIAAAFALAFMMDAKRRVKAAVAPVLLLTQTIPSVALAPILVLWMGFGSAPKVALVFLTCFFPIAVALENGFAQADPDAVRLLRSMGASTPQVYRYIKIPGALGPLFSGLKISTTYAVAAAVIAEWLGGDAGLGVYMTRVRKSYSFDKMFAVIFVTVVLSLTLMKLLEALERRVTPWNFLLEEHKT
ncbi:MAG: ABC transporter permease [Spirochaetaceae bacterium]|jgi:ABC-type nitrate/sulfonate/bicarbonate transport system permease component|nr:ABC transporter permease [Spirochaetaceae bacterium]